MLRMVRRWVIKREDCSAQVWPECIMLTEQGNFGSGGVANSSYSANAFGAQNSNPF